MVKSMTGYGRAVETIGNREITVEIRSVNNRYLGGDTSLTCSAATQQQIDKRVVELVKRQHDLAKKLLEEHRDKLDELATYLYEKETITGQEFITIFTTVIAFYFGTQAEKKE